MTIKAREPEWSPGLRSIDWVEQMGLCVMISQGKSTVSDMAWGCARIAYLPSPSALVEGA